MGALGYLLDTHVFLWAVQKNVSLSKAVKPIVEDKNMILYISAVSAYEIMNKYRLGKIPEYTEIAENYLMIFKRFDANDLQIKTSHTHYAGKFDWIHRDPFDRMLAAQAYIENLTLITNDSVFDSLPWLNTMW